MLVLTILSCTADRERVHASCIGPQHSQLADVQTGVGPFLAIYLAASGWDEEQVGLALTVGGVAGLIAQTPIGALVDGLHHKRGLIGVALAAVGVAALMIGSRPAFWPILGAQVVIGVASSVFIPAICATSLGIVGHAAFDARQGRNQTFNSAGNVTAALSMGLLGYLLSNQSVFFAVAGLTLPSALVLLLIQPGEIDHERARGAQQGAHGGGSVWLLLSDRPLVILLICSVMFHFANAAMLPLLGQMLAKGQGKSSMLFMSACVMTTQFVVALLSSWSGKKAAVWGRKPLLLIAFAVLPVRGLIYTLTVKTGWLVAIQVLDGVGAGIFGVVSVLAIADLTRGTGRFNLTLGAITTAVGVGSSLSQLIAGSIVHRLGTHAAFLFLAGVAALALGVLYFFMPETRDIEPAELTG